MTRTHHDLFAKQHLETLLEIVGEVTSSRKIVSETHEVDILFVPDAKVQENLTALGILGQIAAHICLIEPFRNSVQIDEVEDCIGKLIHFTQELRRKAKREKQVLKRAEYPRLWILSPTVSEGMIQYFATLQQPPWPSGFYFLQSLRTGLVAIHQLPVNEATLWLRLMGRGSVQQRAITELLALPPGHPMKRKTMEHLSVLQISLSVRQNLDRTQRELAMNLTPVYEQWRQETLQEGRQEGRQEGILEGQRNEGLSFVLRLLTRRFGSIPSETEAHIQSLSLSQIEELGEALLDFSQPSDLDEWIKSHL
ncbi:MAG: DUF4351 domain-containing protein [Acaryochloris sp. RU_4_1]|nr:DUF4351 domain-containing protein [Acaryochloris sp. RU_4_1]NJR54894.1 DUF4351 domain-containing protein [Acaryochloris sp. CRU_2_0]